MAFEAVQLALASHVTFLRAAEADTIDDHQRSKTRLQARIVPSTGLCDSGLSLMRYRSRQAHGRFVLYMVICVFNPP